MEKSKGRKLIQVVVSILIAIALWVYVDTELVTNTTMKVREIPVEFAGEETDLADRGFMLLSGYDATVDLVLEGPRNVLYSLNEEGIRVVAETSDINKIGTQSLDYSVYFPDNVSRNSISVKKRSVYSITVNVGELYTKEIPVYCDVIGEVAGGYFKGEASIDISTLSLHAQREDLLNVSYAKVEVSASGAIDTITQTLNYTLYDYNNVPVENGNIRSATKVIQVTVPVRTSKTVPLKMELIGVSSAAADTVSYVVEPERVTLVGERTTLENISGITLDRIYVEDLQPYQTFTYEVKAPLGTTISGDVKTALVTVSVNGAAERTLPAQDITCINVADDLKVTEQDETVMVTVWGLREEVEALENTNIQISADLSEVTEPGTYQVPAKIIIDGYKDVTVKGEYEISVTVELREAEEPETEGN